MTNLAISFDQQRRFEGLDLFHVPQDLGAGLMRQADNLLVDGGELVTRPGLQGQLASPLGAPIYAPFAFVKQDKTTEILFVCGGSTSGRLYRWAKGDTLAHELLLNGASFALVTANVFMTRVGRYAYVVDGVHPLYRINLDESTPSQIATAVTGLDAPTTAPGVSPTNSVIDPMSDASLWSSFPSLSWPGVSSIDSWETISAPLFPGGSDHNEDPPPTGWLTGGDSMDFNDSVTGTGRELYMDAGSGDQWCDWDYPTPTYPAGQNTIKNARVFLGTAFAQSGGGGSFGMKVFPESVAVLSLSLIQYTDLAIVAAGAHATCYSAAHPFQSADLGKVITVFSGSGFTHGNYTIISVDATSHVATVNGAMGTSGATGGIGVLCLDSGFGTGGNYWGHKNNVLKQPPSAILGAELAPPLFTASSSNSKFTHLFSFASLSADFEYVKYRLYGPGANATTGVNTPSFQVVDVRLNIGTSAAGALHLKPNNPLGGGLGANCLGGVWIKRDYSGEPGGYKDFSTSNIISVGYSAPSTTPSPSQGGIPWRFGFLKAGLTIDTIAWSNKAVYAADGLSFSCDCSTVDSTIRAQTKYLFLQILSDLPATIDVNDLCTLGPMLGAGNLSVGEADYLYYYTEMDDLGTDGVIESDPSPLSVNLTPSTTSAEARVQLPTGSTVNPSATHFNIYRRGGTNDPEFALLVAKVPIGVGASSNSYAAWDGSHRVLVDNTPDSHLDPTAILVTGRGKPPDGASALCEWQGRLWLAVGSTLYGSWLITSDQAAALYFNRVNLPEDQDPNASIKGMVVSVGGLDNDPISALVSNGGQLVILKGRARRLLVGIDPTDFQLMDDHTHAGVGCVAPRAVELIGGLVWTLTPSGVFEFQGADPAPRSLAIEAALTPGQAGGTALPPQYYSGCAMVYHGRRLYLFAPASNSDTKNTCAYLWDSRQDAWTRYLWPAGVGITGAASLSSATDTDDLYLAGTDGQIYQLTGNGDKATPASTAQPVVFAFSSRGFGQQSADAGYYRANIATRAYVEAATEEETVLTVGVAAKGNPSVYTQGYTFHGYRAPRLEIGGGIKGGYLTVSVSGATVTPTRLMSCAIEYTQGGFDE